MSIQIRKGEPTDIQAVYQLILDLAIYEKAPNEVKTTPETMLKDGFGDNPLFQFFVAERQGKVIGLALYYFAYSTWKGKVLYLDDLVVAEAERGNGIGKMLLNQLLKEARLQSCKRMHWQVLDWNGPAIGFYKRLNTTMDAGWINCKILDGQIESGQF